MHDPGSAGARLQFPPLPVGGDGSPAGLRTLLLQVRAVPCRGRWRSLAKVGAPAKPLSRRMLVLGTARRLVFYRRSGGRARSSLRCGASRCGRERGGGGGGGAEGRPPPSPQVQTRVQGSAEPRRGQGLAPPLTCCVPLGTVLPASEPAPCFPSLDPGPARALQAVSRVRDTQKREKMGVRKARPTRGLWLGSPAPGWTEPRGRGRAREGGSPETGRGRARRGEERTGSG